MKIGLGLGITAQQPSAGGGGSGSLYDTSDVVFAGELQGDVLIDADSLRLAKEGTGANPSATITLPNGNYLISYGVSAYDGSASGITLINFRLYSNGVALRTSSAAESVSELAITVAGTNLEFRAPNTGRGGRADNFVIVAA